MTRSRVLVDSLESRRMLSVSLHAGVLTVTGRPASANVLSVNLGTAGQKIFTHDNGVTGSFARGSVTKVVLVGGTLGDSLTVNEANGALGVRVDLFGHAGADTITAGSGRRLISAGKGNDTVVAGDGRDTIFGGENDDVITAGDGKNTVFGGLGHDVITVGDGGNTVFSLGGDDVIHAGSGDDTIFIAHTDTVDAGGGNNTIYEPYADDGIIGNTGGGTDTVIHRRLAKLQAFRLAVIDLLALGPKPKAEL